MSDTAFKIENKPVLKPSIERDKYPLAQLKVGQSFLVDVDSVLSLRAAQQAYGRLHGHAHKFSIVREGNAYRCGRVR